MVSPDRAASYACRSEQARALGGATAHPTGVAWRVGVLSHVRPGAPSTTQRLAVAAAGGGLSPSLAT